MVGEAGLSIIDGGGDREKVLVLVLTTVISLISLISSTTGPGGQDEEVS